MCQRKVNILT
ncbi:hypothetical protein YPPY05_3436, partial [Yersinia pestis PY-05]